MKTFLADGTTASTAEPSPGRSISAVSVNSMRGLLNPFSRKKQSIASCPPARVAQRRRHHLADAIFHLPCDKLAIAACRELDRLAEAYFDVDRALPQDRAQMRHQIAVADPGCD